MKQYILSVVNIFILSFLLAACSSHPSIPASSKDAGSLPRIFPDYRNVTVPCNIAPLNFMLEDKAFSECVARITTPDGNSQTYGEGRKVIIPEGEWHDMLNAAKGKDLSVEVWGKKGDEWFSFSKFLISIAPEPIDEFISYRLIEPSYLLYNNMSISQRNVTNYDESEIFNNKVACDNPKGQCINCHSYQNYKTDNMLFHVRVTDGGTIIVNDGKPSKVDLKRDNTISAGVYPAWHPTEKLIAFSTNTTRQEFHTANPNKTEVFDLASDLILYDVQKDEVSIVSADTTRLEVFPTWSPDGKYLYYCATLTMDHEVLGNDVRNYYNQIKYNIYRRSFNVKTKTFGNEELVYDAVTNNKSVSLPRISPDGNTIIFAQGQYGCFHIWHHDANIIGLPLNAGLPIATDSLGLNISKVNLTCMNSKNYAESYPTWSSNGKWIMCASRRADGNYSRVYISYFDGKCARKAFMLPQADPEQNTLRLKSYNRPEFMVEPVKNTIDDFRAVVKK